MTKRIAIIGAGLLGGSFGLAMRQLYQDIEVVGVSRSPRSREAALLKGAVTSTTDCLETACRDSGLVIVAVPVDGIADTVLRAAEHCLDDALIIDLGSTKQSIVYAVDQHLLASRKFVGTHPIAGSEKTGAENAKPDLFVGKTVVITPGESTPEPLIERTEALWLSLQSKIVRMTPMEHDAALATVSHLPHLVASMLAALLPAHATSLVGSGWLDTTRVASGDPDLWTAICRENGSAIVQELLSASKWLEGLADRITENDFDTVKQWLADSKQIRDAIAAERNPK
jgi:prephenate dehydrogenase